MTKEHMEKRQYKRLFFSKDQNIMAKVSLLQQYFQYDEEGLPLP